MSCDQNSFPYTSKPIKGLLVFALFHNSLIIHRLFGMFYFTLELINAQCWVV